MDMKIYLYLLLASFLPGNIFAASVDAQVNLPVDKIYKLGKSFDELIAQGKEDDDVRKKFKKIISRITTGELLNRWVQFIDQTSTRSSLYRTVFESMTPQNTLKMLSTKVKNSAAVVSVKIQVTELYAPSTDMVSLEELFSKYKITNTSIADVITSLPTTALADLVEYKIKSERLDELHLKNVSGTWKIEQIKQNIISSQMDVILPKPAR